MYDSTNSLTSALDGVVVKAAPRLLYPRDPVPIAHEVRKAPVAVWTGAENLASTAIRSPDRPVRTSRYTD
jgi:hypothetical protein